MDHSGNDHSSDGSGFFAGREGRGLGRFDTRADGIVHSSFCRTIEAPPGAGNCVSHWDVSGRRCAEDWCEFVADVSVGEALFYFVVGTHGGRFNRIGEASCELIESHDQL